MYIVIHCHVYLHMRFNIKFSTQFDISNITLFYKHKWNKYKIMIFMYGSLFIISLLLVHNIKAKKKLILDIHVGFRIVTCMEYRKRVQ